MKKRKFKRVLCTADWHCGHQVGLTHPKYSVSVDDERQAKYERVRREVWKYFAEIVERYRPIDILILNGDALEGKGVRSGGTELISTDRKVQCTIAKMAIDFIKAPLIRMTYGTPCHTGTEEDWEDIIAEAVGAKIGSHEWFEINGIMFDLKHKIGSSSIPHGRLTPLAREILWNQLWHLRGKAPRANVLIRSHTHYFEETNHDGCKAFITPCLQGFGSKFGARECSGTVDIGVLFFDVYESGETICRPEFIHGSTQIAHAEKL